MSDRRTVARCGAALAAAALALLAAGCLGAQGEKELKEYAAPSTAWPTASPTEPVAAAVGFEGRLLLERFLTDRTPQESAGLYEYASGAAQPVESNRPRPEAHPVVSPDGRYAIVAPHTLEDRQTGKSRPLPLDEAPAVPNVSTVGAI